MRRVLLLGAAVWLLMGGVAEARTVVTTPGPYNRWIEESRMPTATEKVSVVESRCPTAEASACTQSDWSVIYFDRMAFRGFAPRLMFWHELGHRFDYALMTPRTRHRFRWLAGIGPEVAWREQFGSATNDTPSEWFAATYENCSRERLQEMTGFPRSDQRRACRMIQRVG